MDVSVRACLLLGNVGRAIFNPPTPEDVHAPAYAEPYFDREVAKAHAFLERFPPLVGLSVLDLGCAYGGMLRALHERGAHGVGVDIDERRVAFALRQGLDARVGSAEELPFPSADFDAIVSDAVLEHLHDLDRALGEARRVLRPGGHLYARWGPAWLSYNGPHLIKCLPVPWVHLLFSEQTVERALERLRAEKVWPVSYLNYKLADFRAMGRVTRRKLRRAAVASGFEIVEESTRSPRRSKQLLSRLPLLDELLAGELVVVLRAP